MEFPRSSGILLHPTSLPGRFGIGDLGLGAYRFADFLAGAGQRIWQVLPLGPTGYGDSPYQCFSASAGNPLLVSLEKLVAEGDLSPDGLADDLPAFPNRQVDFGEVVRHRIPLLRKAARNFLTVATATRREEFQDFCRQNASWLDNFALFMALKEAHGGEAVWNKWAHDIAARRPEALARWEARLSEPIDTQKYVQYQFFKQWSELKAYCHQREIQMMGDIPIFAAHDSADVWAHPELFHLDGDGNPTVQAGVPPDYFSATGQLWGNPLYRWEAIAEAGYAWWIERFRSILRLVDIVRLDHFRGFEAYWEIPGNEKTAINGRWVKAPGGEMLEAVKKTLGELPIVAETLGVITPEVEALRDRFGFPGMGILQFAFGSDPQAPGFRPHNFRRHFVVYTGTHDNDTTIGWWTSSGARRQYSDGGEHPGRKRVRARVPGHRRPGNELGVHPHAPGFRGRCGDHSSPGSPGLGRPSTDEPARHLERQLALAVYRRPTNTRNWGTLARIDRHLRSGPEAVASG